MSTLFEYARAVQRFIRDGKQELIDFEDVITYVNAARREVAMRSQAIRILPPISAPIVSATILNGGTNYTNPTVQISPPDSPGGLKLNPGGAQAVGTAIASGGVITTVDIPYGGDGYFQPVIQISDPTGAGAVVQDLLHPLSGLDGRWPVLEELDVDMAQVRASLAPTLAFILLGASTPRLAAQSSNFNTSQGGTNDIDNLRLLCNRCNAVKAGARDFRAEARPR